MQYALQQIVTEKELLKYTNLSAYRIEWQIKLISSIMTVKLIQVFQVLSILSELIVIIKFQWLT